LKTNTPHHTRPKPSTTRGKREPHPLTKNETDTIVRIIVKETATHPTTPTQKSRHRKDEPTGQNKLIRRLIKHTVEFSRIRRTRSSPAGPVRSRGNLVKLTGRLAHRQTRELRASVGRCQVSASSDLLARRRRHLQRQEEL
jgi:hypothetical protein